MFVNKNRIKRNWMRVLDDNSKLPVYDKPIDQFPSQEFNKGSNGWPANDITLLARATSQKEYEMILARMQEIKIDQPDNSKKSDKQIVSEIMPSWVQSPAEIDRFMEYYNSLHPNEPIFDPVKPADVKDQTTEPANVPAS